MSNPNSLWALVILGLLLIAVLIISIRKNMSKIRRLETKQKEFEEKAAQRKDSVIESLRVLAGSMIDGQVETSEGCYRIKVLLDYFDPSLHEDPRFSVFNLMYEGMEHMPTHEARSEVDKRFLFKLDRQRYELEETHEAAIIEASRELIEHLKKL